MLYCALAHYVEGRHSMNFPMGYAKFTDMSRYETTGNFISFPGTPNRTFDPVFYKNFGPRTWPTPITAPVALASMKGFPHTGTAYNRVFGTSMDECDPSTWNGENVTGKILVLFGVLVPPWRCEGSFLEPLSKLPLAGVLVSNVGAHNFASRYTRNIPEFKFPILIIEEYDSKKWHLPTDGSNGPPDSLHYLWYRTIAPALIRGDTVTITLTEAKAGFGEELDNDIALQIFANYLPWLFYIASLIMVPYYMFRFLKVKGFSVRLLDMYVLPLSIYPVLVVFFFIGGPFRSIMTFQVDMSNTYMFWTAEAYRNAFAAFRSCTYVACACFAIIWFRIALSILLRNRPKMAAGCTAFFRDWRGGVHCNLDRLLLESQRAQDKRC